jgi:hypothetical protein
MVPNVRTQTICRTIGGLSQTHCYLIPVTDVRSARGAGTFVTSAEIRTEDSRVVNVTSSSSERN